MKNFYHLAFTFLFGVSSVAVYSQAVISSQGLHKVKELNIRHTQPNQNVRFQSNIVPVQLDYIQSDSNIWHPAYGMNYIFNFNSRYGLADTSSPAGKNYFLLNYFGVSFDTMLDAPSNTTYHSSQVVQAEVDSLYIILGHENFSATNDTFVVQIDSVSNIGWPVKVLHSDTTITSLGLSPSNSWYNAFYLTVKPNYIVNNSRFGVFVYYYGNKQDTCGFIPGWGYQTCNSPAANMAQITNIGLGANPTTWNSLTNGFEYYNNRFYFSQNPITYTGTSDSLAYTCSSPIFTGLLYFQDNPIIAYCKLTVNLPLAVNSISSHGLTVSQNFPNPFNKQTQIRYNLAQTSDVQFKVCDITGREIINTKNANQPAGDNYITLNGGTLSPGVYFYTINVNGYSVTQKMVVSR